MFKDLYRCKHMMIINKFSQIIKNNIYNHNNHNTLVGNYDACVFIPYGPKCYIWFTIIDNDPKCILININKDRTLSNNIIKKIRFDDNLAHGNGTILCGVKNNNTNIIIEDIILYKNTYTNKSFTQKMNAYKNFFCKEYINDKYNQLNFSLAWIRNNINDEDIFYKIPYDVYSVKYFSFNSNKYRIILTKNEADQKKIKHTFLISKKDQCELYELYILNNDDKPIVYNYALINDLYTSKKMKNAFHENENSTLTVKCIYNKKYKGWVPQTIIKDNSTRITNINEIRKYPSNYF